MSRRLIQPTHSLSFAGCAWLFPYHLGVIEAWKEGQGPSQSLFLGASSGALAATIAALGLDPREMLEMALDLAYQSRRRAFGPVGQMTHYVRSSLGRHLPEQAPQLLRGRLKISVTVLPQLKAELIDAGTCRDKEELIQLLLGSCYIPLYYEKPVKWQGRWLLDGGVRNNQPCHSPWTIRVSPYRLAHIRPSRRPPARDVLLPEPRRMEVLFAEGYTDAHRFFSGRSWLQRKILAGEDQFELGL